MVDELLLLLRRMPPFSRFSTLEALLKATSLEKLPLSRSIAARVLGELKVVVLLEVASRFVTIPVPNTVSYARKPVPPVSPTPSPGAKAA